MASREADSLRTQSPDTSPGPGFETATSTVKLDQTGREQGCQPDCLVSSSQMKEQLRDGHAGWVADNSRLEIHTDMLSYEIELAMPPSTS